jgi:tRNA pseudouridine38-40 synthase
VRRSKYINALPLPRLLSNLPSTYLDSTQQKHLPVLRSVSSVLIGVKHFPRDTVQISHMPHWKLTLAYDGTPYNGWQIQPNLPTVQGALAHAIHHITGETTLPQGSGRTDTGVHALAQVATVTLATPIPGPNLHRALNRILPPSIRVLSVEQVPAGFHARHSARRKTYEYRILPGNQICSPMLAPYVWAFQRPLDLATLQQAATYVIGTHDFTSFAATDPDLTNRDQSEDDLLPDATESRSTQEAVISTEGGALAVAVEKPASLTHAPEKEAVISTGGVALAVVVEKPASLTRAPEKEAVISTGGGALAAVVEKPASLPPLQRTSVRTINHSTWHQQENLYIYRVTGSGFLHHMVRNLVGTFVQTATGHIPVEAIPKILAARNRSAAGFTAPARGLFLVEVEY